MLKIERTDLAVIEDIIGITYVSTTSGEDLVCLSEEINVRPEFLETFNKKHVQAYILDHVRFEKRNGKKMIPSVIKVPYPKDSISFWNSVFKINPTDLNILKENTITVSFF
jgi:hypothetical protein